MKVLFVKDLKKQGKKGDVKEVKDGYAENFLIKNGYAVKLDEKNLTEYKKNVKLMQEEEEKLKREALTMKNQMETLVLTFKVKTGDADKVYGSISTKQIKDELAKQGYSVSKNLIEIDSPIASLGFHYVKLNLHKEVVVKVKVHVIK